MPTAKPLVSAYISAYNHEKYIEEAVRGLINQTYENMELIVLDDGSTDATYQKLLKLKPACEKRFKRVVMETHENIGLAENLNRIISLAQGKFFFGVASDDIAKPQAVEVLENFLSKNPEYVFAIGDNEIIDGHSRRIGWDKKRNAVPLEHALYRTFGEMLQKTNSDLDFHSERFGTYQTFVSRNYIPNGGLARLDAIKKAGGYTKEAPLEDWYMMLQLSKIGKMKYFDDILLSYRWHGDNTVTHKEIMRKISYQTKIYEKKLVSLPGNEHWKKIYDQNIYRIRVKYRLGRFLKYYKIWDTDTRTGIFEIFGKKFVLKRKSVKPENL